MGTYGSFTQPFCGFSASQDCSVGYWSDHEAEAKAYERRQAAAQMALLAQCELFHRVYDRFAQGDHRYRRHLVHLDRERTKERDDDYKIRFDLPARKRRDDAAFDGGPGGRIAVHLYLKSGVAPVHRELALAGFILSQAAHFRELFQIEAVAPAFGGVFSGWGWTESCLAFPRALMMALANEAALGSDGSVNAALLRSAIDGAPIPAEVIAAADVGLLIRFAPDAQWPQILQQAMTTMGDLQRHDSMVRAWWGPLFAEG
ncbi:MAG: hypothetical protein ABIF71_02765 [Planctomycetota bacterium]